MLVKVLSFFNGVDLNTANLLTPWEKVTRYFSGNKQKNLFLVNQEINPNWTPGILKLSTFALITSREVIIARYDTILDPLERENLYHNNLLSIGVRNNNVIPVFDYKLFTNCISLTSRVPLLKLLLNSNDDSTDWRTINIISLKDILSTYYPLTD